MNIADIDKLSPEEIDAQLKKAELCYWITEDDTKFKSLTEARKHAAKLSKERNKNIVIAFFDVFPAAIYDKGRKIF